MKSYTFSFSVINLFILPVWFEIFGRRGVAFFNDGFVSNHMQIPAVESFDYAAGIIIILGLSLLLGTTLYLFKIYSKILHRWLVSGLVILLALHGANIIRIYFMPAFNRAAIIQLYEDAAFTTVFGGIVLALTGLTLVTKFMPFFRRLVLIGLPIGVVVLANAAAAIFAVGENSLYLKERPMADTQSNRPKGFRVVWIIFDEFDYRLGFEKRPGGLDLKYFDEIGRRAFTASQAIPPGYGTFPSMPSLIMGDIVANAAFDGLDVKIQHHKSSDLITSSWRALPNIFSDLHDRGFNTMAIGQDFIPYCRSLGQHMAGCVEFSEKWPPAVTNAIQYIPNFVTRFLTFIPGVNRRVAPQKFDTGWRYRKFLQTTKSYIINPKYDLVFAHWAVPHTPYVYDRKTHKFVYSGEVPKFYFDNLALADVLLKETIDNILQSSVAAQTAVIISSDHHWRAAEEQWDGVADSRVPFIVMLPGLKIGQKFDGAFNTVLTKSLIEALIAGRIKTYQDISEFIHRSVASKKYTK